MKKKSFTIKIAETYCYEIKIEATNGKEALEKAKIAYKNNEREYDGVFCADATTYENTKFTVIKK